MATEIKTNPQSRNEIRIHTVDFTPDLMEGVTVLSVAVTHTPPSGAASVPDVSVASPLVFITLGPLAVVGRHMVEVLATLSDNEKSSVRLVIPVIY